jgi:DHA1 family tetracycline resistance protein-like MFS transporter
MKDKRIHILFAIVFMTQVGAGALLPILAPFVEERLGATPTQAMLIVAAFYFAQFLAAPILGKIADRKGRKPILILSQIGTIFAYVGIIASEQLGLFIEGLMPETWLATIGITGGAAVLFATRIFDGITGGNVSIAQAFASDISSKSERATVLGYIGGATGLGYVIGPVFGGLLSTINVLAPFYAAVALTILTTVLTQVFLKEGKRKTPHYEQEVTQTLKLGRTRALLVLSAFISIFGFSALQNIFPLFGHKILFIDPEGFFTPSLGIGVMLTFVGLVIALSQIFVIRPLVRRVSLPPLVIAGNALLAIGAMVVYFTSSPLMVLLAFIPFGLGYAISLTSMQTMMSQSGEAAQQGRLLGVLQSSISLGYILGPPIAGFAFSAIGLRTPFLVAAGAFFVTSMIGFMLPPSSNVSVITRDKTTLARESETFRALTEKKE